MVLNICRKQINITGWSSVCTLDTLLFARNNLTEVCSINYLEFWKINNFCGTSRNKEWYKVPYHKSYTCNGTLFFTFVSYWNRYGTLLFSFCMWQVYSQKYHSNKQSSISSEEVFLYHLIYNVGFVNPVVWCTCLSIILPYSHFCEQELFVYSVLSVSHALLFPRRK